MTDDTSVNLASVSLASTRHRLSSALEFAELLKLSHMIV